MAIKVVELRREGYTKVKGDDLRCVLRVRRRVRAHAHGQSVLLG